MFSESVRHVLLALSICFTYSTNLLYSGREAGAGDSAKGLVLLQLLPSVAVLVPPVRIAYLQTTTRQNIRVANVSLQQTGLNSFVKSKYVKATVSTLPTSRVTTSYCKGKMGTVLRDRNWNALVKHIKQNKLKLESR